MTELEFSLLWDNIIVPEANIIAYDSNVFFAENLKMRYIWNVLR